MATLKGDNLRVFSYNETTDKYEVIGMSTDCTVTLNTNTEEGHTKDDFSVYSKPLVNSQSWTIQVNSMSSIDANQMLADIKAKKLFKLMWDESGGGANQTPQEAGFRRSGYAYLNDVTFNFNDRENSAMNLQFTGQSALTKETQVPYASISVDGYTKGQFVRLILGSDATTATKVIGAAKQLSMHVSVTLEDVTTKDTEGLYQNMEPTMISYDITSNALVRGNDTITSETLAQDLASIEDIYEAGTPVRWKICNMTGDNQRTIASELVNGFAIINSLTINAPSRQNATYTAQLQGYGAYNVSQ